VSSISGSAAGRAAMGNPRLQRGPAPAHKRPEGDGSRHSVLVCQPLDVANRTAKQFGDGMNIKQSGIASRRCPPDGAPVGGVMGWSHERHLRT
jgi:hypothetical protein